MREGRKIEGIRLEKLLPLGSVVKLKGVERKVMIIGSIILVQKENEDAKMFDYLGCLYPIGIMSEKTNLHFYNEYIE